MWMNGGPRCSSMEGILREHGPLLAKNDASGLYPNEWSWNRIANMQYITKFVWKNKAKHIIIINIIKRFSPIIDGDCDTNDNKTAQGNVHALLSFLEKFPEYKGRDLYIAGESYAGIYIVTLATKIMETDSILKTMMKGLAMGNPVMSSLNRSNSNIEFMRGHAILSQPEYDYMRKSCNCSATEKMCNFVEMSEKSESCERAMKWHQIRERAFFSDNINYYNIIGECVFGNITMGDRLKAFFSQTDALGKLKKLFNETDGENKMWEWFFNYDSCIGDTYGLTNWLNKPEVREALHIHPSVGKFELCQNMTYEEQHDDVYYEMKALIDSGVRVMVFSGDSDYAVNFIGAEYFIRSLGYKPTSYYRQWVTPERKVGGWWQSFGENLQLVVVRASGHMVPTDTPMSAFYLFDCFIRNKYDLPVTTGMADLTEYLGMDQKDFANLLPFKFEDYYNYTK
ncbi:lysosomal protective protein-like [Convolutriloba macropyga]|uniref:lysosomal protective protein-like n=1 Tax=Convolutriloba macropyga TaxID=536237 RepID=UPI003F521B4A